MNKSDKILIEKKILDEYRAATYKDHAIEKLESTYKDMGYDKAEIVKVLRKNGAYKDKKKLKAVAKEEPKKAKLSEQVAEINQKEYKKEIKNEDVALVNTKVGDGMENKNTVTEVPEIVFTAMSKMLDELQAEMKIYDQKMEGLKAEKNKLHEQFDELSDFMLNYNERLFVKEGIR
jgi:hypothetical protein